MKIRGFEICKGFEDVATLPTRGSKNSAGYDFYIPLYYKNFAIPANSTNYIISGVKSYMLEDEYLQMHIRSSVGIKKGIILSNITGIIDSDFYNNEENEGNITIALTNLTDKRVTFHSGDRICQGIFTKYLKADNDNTKENRTGGIGSSGIK